MKSSQRARRILFLVMGCLLAASIGVMYWVGRVALTSTAKIANQRVVIEHLEEVLSTLKDAETGQRGYLLTGNESYLDPYSKALPRLRRELDELKRLVATGDLPETQIRQVITLVDQKLIELDQTIRFRRGQGLAAALKVVESKKEMDQIRVILADTEASELREHEEAIKQADWATAVRTITAVVIGVLNLAFLGWVYQRLNREIRHKELARVEAEQRKEFLATTLTSIGDAVIVTDAQGQISSLNDEAERLTGWNKEEALGRPLPEVFRIVNEHTHRPVENPVEKVLRTGAVAGLANHTVLVARDGREVPIDDSGAPVRKKGGPPQGAVLVFRDISVQRRAQQATERLAAIVEFSDDAIISKALDGRIQTWNRGAERLFGYASSEAVGQPITFLLPSDRQNEEAQLMARLQRGESIEHFETVRVGKDGRRVEVSVTVSPLKDEEGRVTGASKIVRDITPRKQAKEDWERTFDSVPDLISILDPQHRIVRVNRAFAKRLSKTPEECVGLHCFSCVHGLRQPLDNCPHVLTCKDGQPHSVEVHEQRLGGDFLVTTTPLRNGQGELVGSVHVARDVTEIKRAAQVLRESEERRKSEERIRQLNDQLERRVSELAAANSELEAFSYSVSHDLRAPLRQVAGFASLLQEAAGDRLDAQSAEYLPLIQKAVKRMGQLIDDLLAFSRMGRAELKQVEVNLHDLVDQVRHTLESAARGRTIEWEIGSLPVVRGDPTLLGQVMANLLDNALKFTRRCPRARIRIGSTSGPHEHVFFVADNGVGFDPRYMDKLFGVFQRLHKAGEFEGTGIGLASVRRIIQRHGGRTWAESAVGQGTTIYFSLPVS